jgi:hypothetical protein
MGASVFPRQNSNIFQQCRYHFLYSIRLVRYYFHDTQQSLQWRKRAPDGAADDPGTRQRSPASG